jgi:peptide/nickel transport system permease protein
LCPRQFLSGAAREHAYQKVRFASEDKVDTVTLLKEFILPRLVQWVLVIVIGVTITFLIPRLSPVNPIDQALGRMTTFQNMDPEAVLSLRATLMDLYGLEGSILDQYFSFWGRVIRGDLGPSFSAFPQTS